MFGRAKKAADATLPAERARAVAERSEGRAAKQQERAAKAAAKQQEQAAADAKKAADAERKAQMKSAKAEARRAKKADKNAAKAAKAEAKVAKEQAKKPQTWFERATDPKSAKRAVTVAKVIGPAAAPVALKAATSTREYLDTRRARRLGVETAEVGAYRGPTGPVQARLAGLKRSVQDLGTRRGGDLQATRFSEVAAGRITDLQAAVRASASMPAGRRRATLIAVGRELDQIDADLMTFLVGR